MKPNFVEIVRQRDGKRWLIQESATELDQTFAGIWRELRVHAQPYGPDAPVRYHPVDGPPDGDLEVRVNVAMWNAFKKEAEAWRWKIKPADWTSFYAFRQMVLAALREAGVLPK